MKAVNKMALAITDLVDAIVQFSITLLISILKDLLTNSNSLTDEKYKYLFIFASLRNQPMPIEQTGSTVYS